MKSKTKPAPKTDAERQAARNSPLNELARAKGWKGISEYLTAIKNGKIEIQKRPS